MYHNFTADKLSTLQINCKSVKFSTFQFLSFDFFLLKKYQSDLPDQLQKYERSNHLEIQKYNVCRTGHSSLTYPLTANVSEDMSDQLQKCQKSNHICFQYFRTGFQLSALSNPKNHQTHLLGGFEVVVPVIYFSNVFDSCDKNNERARMQSILKLLVNFLLQIDEIFFQKI